MSLPFLPLGEHRLDPSPGFDPVRTLLCSLWTDVTWIGERVASIATADDPAEVCQELAYLRGDADDALQAVARLTELLLAGHAVDPAKRIGRASAPPYFGAGSPPPSARFRPLGQHHLDPPPDTDPVRSLLAAAKADLLRLDDCRDGFARSWEADAGRAAGDLAGMRASAERARGHVARLIELLLAGLRVNPALAGPDVDALRLFRAGSPAEWLSCGDVDALCRMLRPLDYGVAVRFGDRRWRLFGVACVRRVEGAFRDPRTRGLVTVVEGFADGGLTEAEVDRHWAAARDPRNPDTEPPAEGSPAGERGWHAFQALAAVPFGAADAARAARAARCARRASDDPGAEEAAQVAILRDLFGDPFRPVSADPGWLTRTAVSLAAGIDREGGYDRLPVLADALEEAGCDDAAILGHCRDGGPHARGCWVVDLVLGRA